MLRAVPSYPAAYTHVEPSHDDQIPLLVRWLKVDARSIVVVAPGKQALERSDVAQGLMSHGARGFSVLQRGGIGNIRSKCVLALWLDDKELSEVENGAPAKVALAPWQLDKCKLWRATRHPIELTGVDVPSAVALDPVVRTAVQTVANLSNPGNGLSGYNRGFAVNAFRILRRAGYTWDPGETAAIMATGGWELRDAVEFEKLADDMLAGKALKAGPSQFRADILKQWRDRSEQEEPWP